MKPERTATTKPPRPQQRRSGRRARADQARLEEKKRRRLVVNMFASWCKVCTDELPGFTAVAHEVSGQVRFIGLDSQETGDGAAMAAQFHLRDAGFTLASSRSSTESADRGDHP